MPVSKKRKPRGRGPGRGCPAGWEPAALLPRPATLAEVHERGRRLGRLQPDRFTGKSPVEVVTVLFDGWDLLGSRQGEDVASFVLCRRGRWVGVQFLARPAGHVGSQAVPEATDENPLGVDYLRLIDGAWPGAKGVRDWTWDGLSGPDRLARVLSALDPATGDGWVGGGTRFAPHAVTGAGPQAFLDALARDYETALPVGQHEAMLPLADVVLRDDLPDPDGEVAAMRLLAALGWPAVAGRGSVTV